MEDSGRGRLGVEFRVYSPTTRRKADPSCHTKSSVDEWKESTGYFCLASETARDVAKDFLGFKRTIHDLPMYKFEKHIRTSVVEEPAPAVEEGQEMPWTAIEVFVDDFIAMCQDVPRIKQLT